MALASALLQVMMDAVRKTARPMLRDFGEVSHLQVSRKGPGDFVTAADVIHSWWVPAFAVKRDAIPGFVNEAWTRIEKPGIYRGQCTELCGKDHGFMPVVVEVKSKADYDTWLGERKAEAAKLKELTSKEWTLDELVARGDKASPPVASSGGGGAGASASPAATKGSGRSTTPPMPCRAVSRPRTWRLRCLPRSCKGRRWSRCKGGSSSARWSSSLACDIQP